MTVEDSVTITTDETGHDRVVRAIKSRRCIHGKAAKALTEKNYLRGAEVCAACTFEAAQLKKGKP